MTDILRFLGGGRRGYLLVLDAGLDVVTVRAGDRVLVADGAAWSRHDAAALP